MQDDEYFENHYQFSQGLLNSSDDESDDESDYESDYESDDSDHCYSGVFQTLLFSKCQKDPFSTVSNFGYC